MVRFRLVSEEVARVSAPVCAEPNECWSDETPLLMDEVATQVGIPPKSARTWPFVPAEVVATAPLPFPRSTVFASSAAQPVPPFAVGRMPVTSEARFTSPVETAPAVARRMPVRFAIESVFDTLSADVDSNEETVRFEVVAFEETRFVVVPVETERFEIDDDARMLIPMVEVLLIEERNAIDDDAFTLMPSVVVGVSAPEMIDQSRTSSSDEVERRVLNEVQSAAKRQPKVEPFAVAQVTFPAENASAPEKVVVARPTHCPSTRVRTWPFSPA
jgi:hypothetical protein